MVSALSVTCDSLSSKTSSLLFQGFCDDKVKNEYDPLGPWIRQTYLYGLKTKVGRKRDC